MKITFLNRKKMIKSRKEKYNSKIVEFLKSTGVYYLATMDGD